MTLSFLQKCHFIRKLYNQYESGETTLNNSRAEIENQQNIHRTQMHPQKNPYSPAHVIRKDSTINLQKDGNLLILII